MLAEGQVQGGLAQGIGQALLEAVHYDPESGQLLTASFSDYCLPRAADLPPLEVRFNEHPTARNPLGAKGAGQAGAIGAPQTVMSRHRRRAGHRPSRHAGDPGAGLAGGPVQARGSPSAVVPPVRSWTGGTFAPRLTPAKANLCNPKSLH